MKILVVNAGSSSLKYKLFLAPLFKVLNWGCIERIGLKGFGIRNHQQAVKMMFTNLLKDKKSLKDIKEILGIGHRVVHGGGKIKKPVFINGRVIKIIREYCNLAPLHNPANLEGILACKRILPQVKQVAVFDTAFHQTMPARAYIYALPYNYYREYGIRRYGFHGTSHEYVSWQASKILKKPLKELKIITCHLGNGCSITAIKKGKSVDTSMGFTPLEGLVMGTRCGDIDPALVFFLMEKGNLSASKTYEILNQKSGLLGISGISNDLRILRKGIRNNKRVKLSLEIFTYRIKKYIGSYISAMGGLDCIVFTGGIGENNPWIIKKIVRNLNFLRKEPEILIIPTDEEKMIAYHTYRLIRFDKYAKFKR